MYLLDYAVCHPTILITTWFPWPFSVLDLGGAKTPLDPSVLRAFLGARCVRKTTLRSSVRSEAFPSQPFREKKRLDTTLIRFTKWGKWMRCQRRLLRHHWHSDPNDECPCIRHSLHAEGREMTDIVIFQEWRMPNKATVLIINVSSVWHALYVERPLHCRVICIAIPLLV